MQVIKKDKIQMLVLNDDDEIIITSANGKSYVSIYETNGNMTIDGTINSKNYMIPFKERLEIDKQRALKTKERNHQAYLKRKGKV